MLQSTKLNLNLNIIIFRKPKMSSHDHNEGGCIMNTLLKCFNSSSCCKRRINNHLHLRGLDPSSFSPFPVCKLLVMWDGYGIHHEHLIGEPQPPEESHLSSNREGAHHILDKISGGGSHCSRWIFRPQQAVCPMQRSSAQTTY